MFSKSLKSLFSIAVVFMLVGQTAGASIYNGVSAQKQEVVSTNNINYLPLNGTDDTVEPQAAPVLIFFAGIAVGFIVDGAIQY